MGLAQDGAPFPNNYMLSSAYKNIKAVKVIFSASPT